MSAVIRSEHYVGRQDCSAGKFRSVTSLRAGLAAATGLMPLLTEPAYGQTTRFGSWEVICSTSETAKSCQTAQRQVVPGHAEPVFAITVLNSKQHPVAIVSVPLGGYLAPGMQVTIDRKPPFKLLYETCNASGCHAGFALSGRILRDMQQGKAAVFRLWTGKTKPVDVNVQLDGLAEALLRMKETAL